MGKLKRKSLNVKTKYQIHLSKCFLNTAAMLSKLSQEKIKNITCFPYLGNTALINLKIQLNQKPLCTTV